MSKVCQISGKRPRSGHNVSHSNRRTKRRFLPNLQVKRILNPATGRFMRVKVATSMLRTLSKWVAEGKMFDLRKLVNKK